MLIDRRGVGILPRMYAAPTYLSVLFPLLAAAVGLLVGVLVCRSVERGATGALAGASRMRRGVCGAVCACAYAALAAFFGPTVQTLELCAFAGILLHLSLTDLDRLLIPNSSIVAATAVRAAYLAFELSRGAINIAVVGYYLGSALAVGVMLLATVLLADRLLGADSMGGGDLKLFVVGALYVGWQQSILLVFLACLLGLAFAAVRGLLSPVSNDSGEPSDLVAFPFGPSIALACVVTLFCGPSAQAWFAWWLG